MSERSQSRSTVDPPAPSPTVVTIPPGATYAAGFLDRKAQEALRDTVREIVARAPFYRPSMPRTGKPFSVIMSNCGPLGWVSDRDGYRYQDRHPQTGEPWPPMPEILLEAWQRLAAYPHPPEACLINFYDETARLGLHVDQDETDFEAPVVSLSLGDTAVFRIGGDTRKGPTRSIKLKSGDAIVLGGPARRAYHGVDRILPGSSDLLKSGRLNLTMRRVTRPK